MDPSSGQLKALLEHLLEVLDADRQEEIDTRHRRALDWEPVDRLPVIVALPTPRELRFTPYPHGEIFHDPEKMLFNELVYAFNTSIASRDVLADDLPCTIRANFGTGVIASLFGAPVEQVADNPPWIRHDGGNDTTLETVLDHDPLDFTNDWCSQVLETYRFYQAVLSEYPELQRLVRVVLPDLQGPFDNLELAVGSGLFIDLCTNQDLVSRALEAMAAAQVGLARHLAPYLSETSDSYAHQHATMIKGTILLRDDSTILMSPETYRKVVAPHDERVMRELGGGGIHSCGTADAHLPAYLELPSLRCLDLGQSEMNDLDRLYPKLRKSRVPLTRVNVSRDDLATARIMERFPTGLALRYHADSIRHANETLEAYRRSADARGSPLRER